MINADDCDYTMNVGRGGVYTDVLTGEKCDLSGNITLRPFESRVFVNGDFVISALDEVSASETLDHALVRRAAGGNCASLYFLRNER